MKFVRYGLAGEERPGCLDAEGRVRDLSAHVDDLRGSALAPRQLAVLAGLKPQSLPLVEDVPRFGVPVSGIGKILGIGLNYRSHAAETGATPGAEPMMFSKAITALSGPDDPIVIPPGSVKTDWEVELAVVIGLETRYVTEDKALSRIAGFTLINDVSERSYQKERGGQFVKGKSCDSFAPIGPWLVTVDEIADPQNVDLWLDVNGVRRQRGNTSDMIFPLAHLISHISQFMTLLPGDVIATGTPDGVGAGQKPPQFLKPGDTVELGAAGLGRQYHDVIAYAGEASDRSD
ncbi:MAG: fumarylacetoacetate hydrolase family protein [Rhodospirillales bacterium]|nr:fumarylacetoacetate hydrolase family protein [Rhodospirillales bacterium]